MVRGEGLGEPVVEGREDVAFGEVDVAGVLDGVGERVLLGVTAAVIRLVVVPLALHAPGAAAAAQQAAQHVGMADAAPFPGGATGAVRCQNLLGAFEGFCVDERLVDLLG